MCYTNLLKRPQTITTFPGTSENLSSGFMFQKTKSRTGFWMVSPNPACKDSSAGGVWGGRQQLQFYNDCFSGTSPLICDRSDLASEPSLVTVHGGWHKSHSQAQPLASIPGCRFPSCSCRLSLSSTTSLPGKPWQVMLSVEVCSPGRKKSVVLMSVVKYFKVC